MLNIIWIILLLAAHVVLIHVIRGLKSNIASGVDFTLTAALITGYWYGWQWGFIVGALFEITSYAVQMQFSPTAFVLIPLVGCVGVWGALIPILGIPILTAVFIGVTAYWIISSAAMMFIIGDRDYVSMASFFLGSIITNWVFFKMFF